MIRLHLQLKPGRPIKAAWKIRFGYARDAGEISRAQTTLKILLSLVYILICVAGECIQEIFMVMQLRFQHHSTDRTWDTPMKCGVISHVHD